MAYNDDELEDSSDFKKGFQEALSLAGKDPAKLQDFMKFVPNGTEYYRGLHAGKSEAEKLAKAGDYSDKLESNYKRGFNIGYWLSKGDEKEYQKFLSELRHKDNTAYQGYVDGGKEAELERKEKTLENSQEQAKAKFRENGLDI